MCGIAGVISEGSTAEIEAVQNMMTSIAHRGPDSHGEYHTEGVALGHRRLAIIDPRGGQQPMCNEDGSIWIVFNGAIYNYLELRQELTAKGHSFSTYTDTEVIIHLFEEYGEACLDRMNGMFAFAIYNTLTRSLFAARDRFGIKPFYYAISDGRFVFASEVKALFASGFIRSEVNPDGLKDYLTFQFTLDAKTMFKGIFKLEPGNFLRINLQQGISPSIKQWWDINFEIDTEHTEDYFLDRLQCLLHDSVKLRMRADVPVGSYLSGGLDSSTIAIIAKEVVGNSPFHTFTGTFDEGIEFDESAYAQKVADMTKSDHHILHINAQDFLNNIEKIIWNMDEPSAGPGVFPQYMVAKLAQRYVKVVLGGQGGDELFAGYTRYLVAYLEETLKGGIFETADSEKHAVTLESIIPNLPMLKQYVPMLKKFWGEGLFDSREQRYFRLVDRSEGMKSFFSTDLHQSGNYSAFEAFCKIFSKKGRTSYINQMCYFDCKASLPALLQVDDRTGMAVGLESRLPLLDYRIAELYASIPPAIKFGGGKSKVLFRRAIRNMLPQDVLKRKDKMGFPVPLNKWYSTELRDFTYDTLLSSRASSRGIYDTASIRSMLSQDQGFSRVLWGILCIEIWYKTFIDNHS